MTDQDELSIDAPAPPEPKKPRRPGFLRGSGFEAAKRVLFLVSLILLMLVPLGMVEGIVQERSDRKREVVAEIGDAWGPSQLVGTPVLVIPYETVERRRAADGSSEAVKVRHLATFLPQQVGVTANATPEYRYKSIYEVLVFTASVKMSGRFAIPDFSRWQVTSDQIRWQEARLAMLLPGTRALRSVGMTVNEKALEVEGLTPDLLDGRGLGASLKLSGPQALEFEIDLAVNGRESLSVQPLGAAVDIDMAGTWPHPNFFGAQLPESRDISKKGFSGRWAVNHLATGTPLSWRDGEYRIDADGYGAIGVMLAAPGDVHQQTERIVKYGLLVVGLTFGTIFVVGLLKRDRVHLVQYLLIGAALSLFYLLLLSLAEQIAFARAYLIASLVNIAIVSVYAAATIRRLVGLLTGVILAALHTYMFVLLQMESYSLLAGTVGLLVILVLVMAATRKVDWFALGGEGAPKLAAA